VAAIVAKGFARIFYWAPINQGLLLIECPGAVEAYKPGSKIEIDAAGGQITVDGRAFSFPKLLPEIMAIWDAGGLLEYTRKKLRARKRRGN